MEKKTIKNIGICSSLGLVAVITGISLQSSEEQTNNNGIDSYQNLSGTTTPSTANYFTIPNPSLTAESANATKTQSIQENINTTNQSLLENEFISENSLIQENQESTKEIVEVTTTTTKKLTDTEKDVDENVDENTDADENADKDVDNLEDLENTETQEETALVFNFPISSSETVLPFSVESAIYDPTLDQYRTNSSISLSSKEGDQVTASEKGIVKEITKDEEKGNSLVVEHKDGWSTTYSQLASEMLVAVGDTVEKGQALALVAQPTKYTVALGEHLEFSISKDGKPQNPQEIINKN